MFNNLLKAAVLSAAVLVPGVASAAANAIVTTDLNMRAGPSTGYERVATIPGGGNVVVHGCATGFSWCDITWAGARGWVSSNYLAYLDGGRRRSIASFGISIGLPTVGFDRDDYYRRYHGGWHNDRRDHDWDRDNRRERRVEHRQLRQERRDVQQARHGLRQERRDLRQERRAGDNVRQERRDVRQARRELRQERRDLRRERND